MPNTIGQLAEHFSIGIQPLLKIGGQDFSIEEFGNNEDEFKKYQASNLAAWQNPQELIDCLKLFVNKIDNESEVFSNLHVNDGYFQRGTFKQDLLDLIHMAQWGTDNSARKLRLEAA